MLRSRNEVLHWGIKSLPIHSTACLMIACGVKHDNTP